MLFPEVFKNCSTHIYIHSKSTTSLNLFKLSFDKKLKASPINTYLIISICPIVTKINTGENSSILLIVINPTIGNSKKILNKILKTLWISTLTFPLSDSIDPCITQNAPFPRVAEMILNSFPFSLPINDLSVSEDTSFSDFLVLRFSRVNVSACEFTSLNFNTFVGYSFILKNISSYLSLGLCSFEL